MLAAEYTPIFAELVSSLGDPTTFREKAEQEYNEERNRSKTNCPGTPHRGHTHLSSDVCPLDRPKPKPPAGKNGVKRS